MSEKTKSFFKNHVNHITVTLDKVTVQRTSYTVILTFFFCQGKIHIILNKLATLSTDEYDAVGTAEMLVQTLVETLGISRTRLASVLVHFVYDGVYATKDERVSGGGCLELKKQVAKVHEGENVESGFECPHCPSKTFSSVHFLRHHMSTVHEVEDG